MRNLAGLISGKVTLFLLQSHARSLDNEQAPQQNPQFKRTESARTVRNGRCHVNNGNSFSYGIFGKWLLNQSPY